MTEKPRRWSKSIPAPVFWTRIGPPLVAITSPSAWITPSGLSTPSFWASRASISARLMPAISSSAASVAAMKSAADMVTLPASSPSLSSIEMPPAVVSICSRFAASSASVLFAPAPFIESMPSIRMLEPELSASVPPTPIVPSSAASLPVATCTAVSRTMIDGPLMTRSPPLWIASISACDSENASAASPPPRTTGAPLLVKVISCVTEDSPIRPPAAVSIATSPAVTSMVTPVSSPPVRSALAASIVRALPAAIELPAATKTSPPDRAERSRWAVMPPEIVRSPPLAKAMSLPAEAAARFNAPPASSRISCAAVKVPESVPAVSTSIVPRVATAAISSEPDERTKAFAASSASRPATSASSITRSPLVRRSPEAAVRTLMTIPPAPVSALTAPPATSWPTCRLPVAPVVASKLPAVLAEPSRMSAADSAMLPPAASVVPVRAPPATSEARPAVSIEAKSIAPLASMLTLPEPVASPNVIEPAGPMTSAPPSWTKLRAVKLPPASPIATRISPGASRSRTATDPVAVSRTIEVPA